MQETLHFLIESGSTYNHFIEFTSKSFGHLITDLLIDALVDTRHLHQEAKFRILNLGEYLLLNDLLNDQRNGDDDLWFHF